ncbi:MAG: beta-L-arabinofuranosidase domain-containing protein [Bacilli bacterium]|jgi:hypothetical protein
MIQNKFQYISYDKISPKGWIRQKLEALKDGLTGNLEELWEDVGPDNGWLGGDGNSWERGPYYVDGLIPLSLLLEDQGLERKVLHWIHSVLDSQKQDGSFGPESNEDWWPRMVMLKALIQFADAKPQSKEAIAIVKLCEQFFRYFDKKIDTKPLEMWAYARGMETYVSLIWIYNKTSDSFFLNFAKKIASLSFPWRNKFYKDIPFKHPIEEYMPWEEYKNLMAQYDQTEDQATLIDPIKYAKYFDMYHMSHVVNVAMSVKYLVYEYQLSNDENYLKILKKGLEQLYHYHGQANGMISGDEHISGTYPSRGTELCAVVELLFSLEETIAITGDLEYCDLLERITYNALLTTISQDCCSHQYNQQVNQIACTVEKRIWYNNADDSNIFGLVPYFGCCTANMHQGWPKLVKSLWMEKEEGFVCLSYAPTYFKTNGVTIHVESVYPFRPEAKITISSNRVEEFPIELNIPKWAKSFSVKVNDEFIDYQKKSHSIVIDKIWQKDIIHILFDFSVECIEQNRGVAVYWGPLLFALPIASTKTILHERGRFSDYEYRPESKWNYGFSKDTNWTLNFENDTPTITGKAYEIENWVEEMNSAGQIPDKPDIGQMEIIKMIPYGLTVLRIAVFPLIEHKLKA